MKSLCGFIMTKMIFENGRESKSGKPMSHSYGEGFETVLIGMAKGSKNSNSTKSLKIQILQNR